MCLLSGAAAGQQHDFRFHHLHLVDGLEFYSRLFARGTVEQTTVAGFEGLRSGPMLLLFGRPAGTVPIRERPSAIWHIGWGDVALGETYLRHAALEVEREPPLPAAKLHVHLQSAMPAEAAAWYRDVLGAQTEVFPDAAERRPAEPRPELRVAEAAVRFGGFAMVIHRTNDALASTRGQRVDHIAVECDDLEAALRNLKSKSVPILEPIAPVEHLRHAVMEGPDRIAIELVDASSPW